MDPHEVFAALADPTRLEVLTRLARLGPSTATDLAADLPISRQAVSKHLAALDAADLVERHRSGREVKYSFRPDPLGDVISWVGTVGGLWDERLARLRGQVEGKDLGQ
jgi:DNA-binding transcriptional ArsR family regulator